MRSRNRDLFPAKVRANPPLKHTQMYPSGETPKQSLREGTGWGKPFCHEAEEKEA